MEYKSESEQGIRFIWYREMYQDEPPKGTGGSDDTKKQESYNKGKIIRDATCAPSDIRYPTDISLLNQAREKLEDIIDTLHKPLCGIQAKSRTYRKTARKDYLSWSKKRGKSNKTWKKALCQ